MRSKVNSEPLSSDVIMLCSFLSLRCKTLCSPKWVTIHPPTASYNSDPSLFIYNDTCSGAHYTRELFMELLCVLSSFFLSLFLALTTTELSFTVTCIQLLIEYECFAEVCCTSQASWHHTQLHKCDWTNLLHAAANNQRVQKSRIRIIWECVRGIIKGKIKLLAVSFRAKQMHLPSNWVDIFSPFLQRMKNKLWLLLMHFILQSGWFQMMPCVLPVKQFPPCMQMLLQPLGSFYHGGIIYLFPKDHSANACSFSFALWLCRTECCSLRKIIIIPLREQSSHYL